MATKVLSIKIGTTMTRIVEMSGQAKNSKVLHAVSLPTPPGILNEGMVVPTEEFIQTIRSAIHQMKAKTRKVVYLLDSGRIAYRDVEIPFVNDNRIRDLLYANATEYFPVDLEQYQLVHEVVDRIHTKETKRIKLTVLAVPNDIIASYEQLTRDCGLEMVGMTYIGNAIRQMMTMEMRGEIRTCLYLDEDSAILSIMEDNRIQLQRNVGHGLFEAIAAVAESGRLGEKVTLAQTIAYMQMNPCVKRRFEEDDYSRDFRDKEEEKGEKEESQDKEEINGKEENPDKEEISEKEESQNKEEIKEKEVNELLQMQEEVSEKLRTLISSVNRIIDYYHSRNPEKKIDKIYLTGLGATFADLSKLLGNEIGIRVTNRNRFKKITMGKEMAGFEQGITEYFTLIGAAFVPVAMSSTGRNQSGRAGKASSKGGESLAGPILIFGLCLIASAVLIVFSSFTNMTLQAEKEGLSKRLEELRASVSTDHESQTAQADYEWAKVVEQASSSHNDHLVAFIEELEDKMPSQITVLTLNATAQDVTMNVEVQSKAAAADVVMQLRTFESIRVGTVSTITEEKDDGGSSTVSFSINCTYLDAQGESTTEETATEESVTEEAATEETVTEEAVTEENVTEDNVTEEAGSEQ